MGNSMALKLNDIMKVLLLIVYAFSTDKSTDTVKRNNLRTPHGSNTLVVSRKTGVYGRYQGSVAQAGFSLERCQKY